METLLFWIPWFLASFLILKVFYANYKASYVRALRRTAFGIDILALFLFFLPWIPGTEKSGWDIIMEKNLWAIVIFILLACATFFLFFSRSLFLKIGAIFQNVTGVLFIVAMTQIVPGTVIISLKYIAPIVASLLLLVNIVIVLVLWQQLQNQEKSRIARQVPRNQQTH